MSDPEKKPKPGNKDENKVRQAVVMIHGMGEQRPLDTLFRLANVIVPPVDHNGDDTVIHPPKYYSRPTHFEDEFEARYVIARGDGETCSQADFYEYHWAHLMQGNKLTDIISTVFRMIL